jgi:hypothetical protein
MPANDPGAYFRGPSGFDPSMAADWRGTPGATHQLEALAMAPRGLGAGFPARLTPVGSAADPMMDAANQQMGNPAERALRLRELLQAGITSLDVAQQAYPYAPDRAKADVDLSIMAEYEMMRQMSSQSQPDALYDPRGDWSGQSHGVAGTPYLGYHGGIRQPVAVQPMRQTRPQQQRPQQRPQQARPQQQQPQQSALNPMNPYPLSGVRR